MRRSPSRRWPGFPSLPSIARTWSAWFSRPSAPDRSRVAPMATSPAHKGFGQGDPALADWAERAFQPEDAILQEIRARAQREGLPTIAVGPMDGLHLEVLARACAARKAVEIGTLGGYSGVCLLRGMGPSG